MKWNLTKNNGNDIGFSNSCLIVSVITFEEFKEWIYYVIDKSEEVPNYFFDILDIEKKFDYTLKVSQILGFDPGWEGSRIEESALRGIGYRRFENYHSDFVKKDAALKALEKCPHIEKRFRETFPFIDW